MYRGFVLHPVLGTIQGKEDYFNPVDKGPQICYCLTVTAYNFLVSYTSSGRFMSCGSVEVGNLQNDFKSLLNGTIQ